MPSKPAVDKHSQSEIAPGLSPELAERVSTSPSADDGCEPIEVEVEPSAFHHVLDQADEGYYRQRDR